MNTGSFEHAIDDHATRFLLALARETIRCRLNGKALPSPEPDDEMLLEPRGAFVTLKINGSLRGCIGHVIGVAPLWRAVRDNAIAAAFDASRATR
jgi:AMMECR1 domain-containing protein